ncbi:RNA 2',3'-cyclic phosphodiesterase [Candidatus Woesearchaeota archaeon]|jgi:2'-5' RNA ligase|nr:RNA 2',3'-cyclic phosphodiesterase [Candidatus Woesearchaeota archaeon]
MRCFISLDIPEEIKNEIIKIQEKIPEFIGKKTEKENLHLTLKFLGEINKNQLEIIKEKLKEIKFQELNLSINSIGVFIQKNRIILWLKISGAEELQKKIDFLLKEIFPEEKRFMSHLTIARIKKLKDKKSFFEFINNFKFQPFSFNINSFSLKQSVLTKIKPEYKTIERYSCC